MEKSLSDREELFVVPRGGDEYFLYAPLRRSVAVVNKKAAGAVAAYLDASGVVADPEAAALIDALKTGGILGEPFPEPPVRPAGFVFQPHEVTLFPTSRCNLRCRYCYANAGVKSAEMPWEVGKAAIDLVSENAGLLGLRKFGLGFHGGGEPTLAWDFMVRCVEYARERADAMGLEADIYTATNGLLTDAQRAFIVRNFSTVNVSLDGPADIQDLNRPRADGSGSYDAVRQTLLDFNKQGFRYGVRATVTLTMAPRLTEIVEHLCETFHLDYLHVEPAWQCGRCLTTGEQPPKDEVFADNFLKAREAGRKRGIEIHYSGARLDMLTSTFCAAPGSGFTVLPEGWVTSCYEVTEASDPRAAIFHYGRYDSAAARFTFDAARLDSLQRLSVENLSYCRDCFCKWHCAGDCLAKVFALSGSDNHQGSSRCGLNRALTKAQLEELVGTDAAVRDHPERGE